MIRPLGASTMATGMAFERIEHHRYLAHIAGALGQFGRDADLGLTIRGGLIVVVRLETSTALHDPAVRIGEIVLGIRKRLAKRCSRSDPAAAPARAPFHYSDQRDRTASMRRFASMNVNPHTPRAYELVLVNGRSASPHLGGSGTCSRGRAGRRLRQARLPEDP